ncbi:MAG: SMI1/KNR4 family protein [Streptomyces sp.]|nr:SMI1/KNR4 family protein [Streptomyces sp.]
MADGPDVAVALRGGLGDRARAWGFLRWFAREWTGRPLGPGDGCGAGELDAAEARLGFALPAALREGYALLGRRADLTQHQDPLVPPRGLYVDDALGGVLVFRRENQDCAAWAVPLARLRQDDPPVLVEVHWGWGLLFGSPWRKERGPVRADARRRREATRWGCPQGEASGGVVDRRQRWGHLPPKAGGRCACRATRRRGDPNNRPQVPFLERMSWAWVELVLSETLFADGPYDACELPAALLPALHADHARVPLPDHPMWASAEDSPVRWYAAPGRLLRRDGLGDLSWVHARGRTEADLAAVRAALPAPWVR